MFKKLIIFPLIAITCVVFFNACGETNAQILQKEVNKCVYNTQKTLNELYVPSSKDLNIPAFTDSNNTTTVSTKNIDNKNWHVILSANNSYTPRYIAVEELGGFENYVNKVKAIYVQMSDCLYALNEMETIKDNFNEQFINLKNNVKYIKDNKLEISESQLATSKELIKEISRLSEKLTTNNKEFNSQVGELKECKKNILLNTDKLSTKYLKIINHLDNNISYLKSIKQSIVQIESVIYSDEIRNNNIITESQHYIDSEILHKPISRTEYIEQFEKNNAKDFENKNALKFTPPTKKPLPYRKDPNTPTPLSKPYKKNTLPFEMDMGEGKKRIEYL